MADLLDGLAQLLQNEGLAQYEPTGAGGNLFIEAMPPKPDQCVVLTGYGGPEPDARLPYEERRVQVRVRGAQDPRLSRTRVEAIYSLLHGMRRTTLPDGTYVVLAVAMAPPASMGLDDQRRFEHVVNFRLDIGAPTTQRPAE